MRHTISQLRDDLFGDDLFPRVTIFIMGMIITAIPILALVSGVAFEANDSSFYILLGLFAVLGVFLFYASVRGGEKLLDKAALWGIPAELIFVLGLLTLAAPITIVIKRFRKQNER